MRESRLLNTGPKSPVAQARRLLYQKTLRRIREATEAGFALEAVTLLESAISDRIEARVERLGVEIKTRGKFWPLTKMLSALVSSKSNEEEEIKDVCRKLTPWAAERNKALHGLAKLVKIEDQSWDQKYESAQKAAQKGLELFRELDKALKRIQRRERRAVERSGDKSNQV